MRILLAAFLYFALTAQAAHAGPSINRIEYDRYSTIGQVYYDNYCSIGTFTGRLYKSSTNWDGCTPDNYIWERAEWCSPGPDDGRIDDYFFPGIAYRVWAAHVGLFGIIDCGPTYQFNPPPLPVGTITASTGRADGINVAWGGSTNVFRYAVYRCTGVASGCVLAGWSQTPSYLDSAISYGTNYYYAVDVQGLNNAWSGMVYGTTPGSRLAPPAITSHPGAQTRYVNETVFFTSTASNATSYYWTKNGADISGARSATYSFTVTSGSAGTYAMRACNDAGCSTSSGAYLTVIGAPAITQHPVSQARFIGETASFSAAASNYPTAYQWLKDGASISGANNGSYSFTVAAGSAGAYALRVCSPAGCATSNAAALTINYRTISGNVSLPGGAGLSGVTISGGPSSATTDASGNYIIWNASNGTYTLTPSLAGYSFSPASLSVTVSNANVTGRNFVATSVTKHTISGKVSLPGGAGLQGVTISGGPANAATDASGNYTIGNVPNGSYTLTASLSGYTFAPASLSVVVSGANASGKDFTATSAAKYIISGKVSLPGGAGLAGVTIAGGPANATTDASGNFSIANVPNGGYSLTPALLGYTFSPATQAVTVSGANVSGQNFTATSVFKYTIAGKVSLPGGAGLAGVTIAGGPANAATDASGSYTITNVPNGSYTLTASRSGYTFSPAALSVTVSGANVSGRNFDATSVATYAISGKVTLPGGAGLAGVTISGGPANATTDASGNFTVANAPNGSYTLTPSLGGYTFTPASLALTVSGANLTGQNFVATSVAKYTISGKVTLPGGAGLAGVTIAGGPAAATTDASGNYSIPNVPNGGYLLTPSLAGYTFAPASLALVISGANASGRDFTATSISKYSVSGKVAKASGAGLAGATVSLGSLTATTDANGSYSFAGLANGDYTASASGPHYSIAPDGFTNPVRVRGSNLTDVDFLATLTEPVYTISGYVLSNGVALEGVRIEGGILGAKTTDARGYYEFNELLKDTAYSLSAGPLAGFRFQPASVGGTVSGHMFHNFYATSQGSYMLFGYITRQGRPVSGVSLNGGTLGMRISAQDGSYAFSELASGQAYGITPSKPSYSFAPASASGSIAAADVQADFEASTTTTAFEVSGRVSVNGFPLSGVTISSDELGQRITGADGRFSYGLVPIDTAYSLAPSLSGYRFVPAAVHATVDGDRKHHFIGTQAGTFILYGNVTLSGMPLEAVTITSPQHGARFTDEDGIYAFSNLTAGSAYDASPNKEGYLFLPRSVNGVMPAADVTANFAAGCTADRALFGDACKILLPVEPMFECLDIKEGGYVAHFGYKNSNSFEVSVPLGSQNVFAPTPEDRGQPTQFLTGRIMNAFEVRFGEPQIQWTLGAFSVTADVLKSPLCEGNTPRCEDGSTVDLCGVCGGHNQCLGCIDTDMSQTLLSMISSSLTSRDLVYQMVKAARKGLAGKTDKKSKKLVLAIKKTRAAAKTQHERNQQNILGLPQIAMACTDTLLCHAVDNQSSIAAFRQGLSNLNAMVKPMLKILKKQKVPAKQMRKFRKLATERLGLGEGAAGAMPRFQSICQR